MNQPLARVNPTTQITMADALHAITRFGAAMLRRQKVLAAIFAVAGVTAGAYYVTATRTYRATAQLLIEEPGLAVMPNAATLNQPNMLPTQEKILRSDSVVRAALVELRGQPAALQVDIQGQQLDEAIRTLRKNLAVDLLRNTDVIELSYDSKSPHAAEAVLNALQTAYLDFMRKHHQDTSLEVLQLLKEEREKVESRLVEQQENLVRLRDRAKVFGVDDTSVSAHPAVQRVMRLNDSLTEAQQTRIELQAIAAVVERAIRTGQDPRPHLQAIDAAAAQSLTAAVLGVAPEQLRSLHELEQRMLTDRATLTKLSSHLGPTHPRMVELRAQIANSDQYLTDFRQRVNSRSGEVAGARLAQMLGQMVDQKLQEAQQHEALLRSEYEELEREVVAMNSELSEMLMVQREVERLNRSYDTLLEKIHSVDLGHDQASIRIAVIGEPKALSQPVSPNLLLTIGGTIFASMLCGAGVVCLLDLRDDRFASLDDLEHQTRCKILAVVEKMDVHAGHGADAIQIHAQPLSHTSEAFRTLRTGLLLGADNPRLLSVSSAEPGDGKTTLSSNLAAALAQSGKRTLLIDADLRKPGLTNLFDLRSAPGLSQLLVENDVVAASGSYLQPTGITNLALIPSGPRPLDPGEMLSGSGLSQLLQWAVSHYDQVILDCPPVLVANDVALVSRLTDGLLLVVRPEKNSRRHVLRAVDRVESHAIHCFGLVVNAIQPGKGGHGYGYGYGYGYGDDAEGERQLSPMAPAPPLAAVPAEEVPTPVANPVPVTAVEPKSVPRRRAA